MPASNRAVPVAAGLDSHYSAVALNVVLSVLAGAVCAALSRRLPGYATTDSRRLSESTMPPEPTRLAGLERNCQEVAAFRERKPTSARQLRGSC